jgi:hypothetical protein
VADLSEHKAAQEADAARLSEDAARIGRRALSSVTLEVARRAVASVTETKSRTALDEAVADVAELRSSPELANALEDDLSASQDAVLELMLEAMEEGLDSEMRWQVTQVRGLKWTMTEIDRNALPGYPIQGHTAAEMSAYMHAQLKYEVAGVTAAPLDGSSIVASVPEQLGDLMRRFGDRVGTAINEAYFAGVQLGVRSVAEAISNAR